MKDDDEYIEKLLNMSDEEVIADAVKEYGSEKAVDEITRLMKINIQQAIEIHELKKTRPAPQVEVQPVWEQLGETTYRHKNGAVFEVKDDHLVCVSESTPDNKEAISEAEMLDYEALKSTHSRLRELLSDVKEPDEQEKGKLKIKNTILGKVRYLKERAALTKDSSS